jgi:hypothetical protein
MRNVTQAKCQYQYNINTAEKDNLRFWGTQINLFIQTQINS